MMADLGQNPNSEYLYVQIYLLLDFHRASTLPKAWLKVTMDNAAV